MQWFASEKTAPSVTRIHGITDEQMYLIEGRETAVLVDTGCGVGSLKAYVRSLTDLPVVTLLSHGHLDHAMGAAEFDEVFLNHRERSVYQEHSRMELRRGYVATSPLAAQVREEDYLPAPDFGRFRELEEGDVFDLGGIHVETLACPGHTEGSMMFLIPEERILIAGDACNPFVFLFDQFSLGVASYERNLLRLREKVQGRFDRVLFSHGGIETDPEVLDEVVAVCEVIRRGADDRVPFEAINGKGLIAKAVDEKFSRRDGRVGNLVYDPERIGE